MGLGELPRVPRRARRDGRTTSTSPPRCRTARCAAVRDGRARRRPRRARHRRRDRARWAGSPREGVAAGALGFTTSRTRQPPHQRRRAHARRSPRRATSWSASRGRSARRAPGVLQVVSDFPTSTTSSHCCVAWSRPRAVRCRSRSRRRRLRRRAGARSLEPIDEATRTASRCAPRSPPAAIGVLLGLQATINPFWPIPRVPARSPELPLAEQGGALADPTLRAADARRAAGPPTAGPPTTASTGSSSSATRPTTSPTPDDSIAARAARRTVAPARAASTTCCSATTARTLLYLPILNYTDGNLDAVPRDADPPAHRARPRRRRRPRRARSATPASRPRCSRTGGATARGAALDLPSRGPAAHAATRPRTVGLLRPRRPGARLQGRPQRDRLRRAAPARAARSSTTCPPAASACCRRPTGYRHTVVAGRGVRATASRPGALPGRLVRGVSPSAGSPA